MHFQIVMQQKVERLRARVTASVFEILAANVVVESENFK